MFYEKPFPEFKPHDTVRFITQGNMLISYEIVDEEISIGDYVLTGGEIPACILVDSVSRLVDGVLSAPECYLDESITGGLLEYPQYTRPYEFHGAKVPDVLISGHHENIDKWRKDRSIEITRERRPDLLEKYERS